jgi:hypothetical protein
MLLPAARLSPLHLHFGKAFLMEHAAHAAATPKS